MNNKRKVILDTNALLWQFRSRVNIENELNRLLGAYVIVIPTSVLRELDYVKDRYVKAARKLAERYQVVATELKGDESIISLAQALQAIVVTNDKELRQRLKKKGITVIFMRQGKYLSIDAP
jgi:rRNA-processing protein FCF1